MNRILDFMLSPKRSGQMNEGMGPREGMRTTGVLLVFSLASLLVVTAGPASRAGEFKGTCTDSVLLGSERWPELKQKMAELRELLRVNDLAAGIPLQREIAAMQCHNHYQRYHLAELLVRAGDFAGAVAELDGLYDLKVNDLETRLFNEKNHLYPIVSSDAYAGSALARKVAARGAAAEARRGRFEARLAEVSADELPPSPYVSKNVCPFECCSYGTWSAIEDVTIFASPGSREEVGIAQKGEAVESVTGDVHLTPIPVAVVHAISAAGPGSVTVAEGEIIFLLDHIGEGFQSAWHRGAVREISTHDAVKDRCAFPSEDCWGEYLVPRDERGDSVWWVKVRLPSGAEGWTREIHFDGIEGCG